MSGLVITQAIVVAMVLAVALTVPALSRPDVPFGVQVPPAHRRGDAVALARRRYRATVLLGGVVAVGVFAGLAVAGLAELTLVAVAFVLAGLVAGYLRAHRTVAEVKRREDWYAGVRQAVAVDTGLRSAPPRASWLWALPAVLVLVGTAVAGVLRYPHLPDVLSVHYNGSGVADRTAPRTVGTAFLPVFLQAGLTALILGLVPVITRVRAELDPAAPQRDALRHRRFVTGMARGLMVLAFCLNVTMAVVAYPMWSGTGPGRWLLAALLLPTLVGVAVLAGPALRDRRAGEDADGSGPVARDDDKHWKGGLLYFNPDDPAVFVRKRFGVGWTVNNGNPRGWLVLGLLVAVVVVLVVTSASASATAQPRNELPAYDQEVAFTVDGITAHGTVHVPAHWVDSRLPAVLLLPGSGPTDRDGDQPPDFTPHTLALVADALGERGVITLRFDKYGTGQTSAGDPADLDLESFLRQARAAYDLLWNHDWVDRESVGVLGHSEGGLTGLLLATRTSPKALAMLAPQDVRLLDLVDLQLGRQLDAAAQAGQLTPEQAAANKQGIAQAIADFRAGRPVDTSGLLPQVKTLLDGLFGPTNAKFVRSDDLVYPPDAAAALPSTTRVLLTCGTADVQVPCDTIGPLADATRHAEGPGLLELPVDHELHTPGTDPNAQVLAPEVIDSLTRFADSLRML